MTTFWLILFRIICGTQLILAVFQSFMSLIGLLSESRMIYLFQALAFVFIALLPILALIILSVNYPDKPFTETRRKNFNRLFIINFILISFLSGFVVRDYKAARMDAQITDFESSSFDHLFDINFLASVTMMLFHLVTLYGLVWLRRKIGKNTGTKQFDFEMNHENV